MGARGGVLAAMALVAMLAVATSVGARAPTANDFVIVPVDPATGKRLPAVVRIGPYHYFRDGGHRGAVRAFGLPSSKGTSVPGSNLCTVRWRGLGLDIDFAGTTCPTLSRSGGAWYGMRIHISRWRTDRGLRVGDTVARMRKLYPRAAFRDKPPGAPYWSLIREDQQEFGIVDLLRAEVWAGRVTAIVVPAAYIF